ncbi:hypothetical protein [Sulfitobacter sp. 20_GPM-1509m]|uniref:hypothetical protein n=1 Tax=Sulfitobacter sp. 20_GPM-1509m TaxID=1380367 RepID=UPI00056003BD|nr:hypothetical protein [Sulfitobacter sp. 20_GPM-1509m]
MRKYLRAVSKAVPIWILSCSGVFAGVFYDCDMNTKRPDGWVSPKIGLVFDDRGKVTVIDNIILTFAGSPITARARKNGDTYRITWVIANTRDAKGQTVPTFSYIAKLNTMTQAISVVAKPVHFPQRFSGKGTCVSRTKPPKEFQVIN